MKCEYLVTYAGGEHVCNREPAKIVTAEKNIGGSVEVVACAKCRHTLRLKGFVLKFTRDGVTYSEPD